MTKASPLTLAQYLAQPGNSQTRLARKSGLNPSTICRVLSGKGGCSMVTALRIDRGTDGALRAETLCPFNEASLVARLRGTACGSPGKALKPARAASADFDLPAPNDAIAPS